MGWAGVVPGVVGFELAVAAGAVTVAVPGAVTVAVPDIFASSISMAAGLEGVTVAVVGGFWDWGAPAAAVWGLAWLWGATVGTARAEEEREGAKADGGGAEREEEEEEEEEVGMMFDACVVLPLEGMEEVEGVSVVAPDGACPGVAVVAVASVTASVKVTDDVETAAEGVDPPITAGAAALTVVTAGAMAPPTLRGAPADVTAAGAALDVVTVAGGAPADVTVAGATLVLPREPVTTVDVTAAGAILVLPREPVTTVDVTVATVAGAAGAGSVADGALERVGDSTRGMVRRGASGESGMETSCATGFRV